MMTMNQRPVASPKPPYRVWLVWAEDGATPSVCELVPPDLDRLEVAGERINGTQIFSFDATRPGVRRPYYTVSARPNKFWRWQRKAGGPRGASMIFGGWSADEALARFREHAST